MSPSSKRWLLSVAALVAVGAAVLGLFTVRHGHARTAGARGEARAVSSKNFEALRQEGELSGTRAGAPSMDYVVAAPARVSPSDAKSSAAPADRTAAEERHQQFIATLEARFASERAGGQQSASAARHMRDAIVERAAGAAVLETDCASSLCRVVVAHDTEESQRNLAPRIAALEPFRLGIVYDYDSSAVSRTTTLFVLLPGASFAGNIAHP
jgi:hypothetical protein